MSWQRQSEEKIAAFFEEFPFLGTIVFWEFLIVRTIVSPRNTCSVKVSRVSLDLIKEYGNFFIFDDQGNLIGETRKWQDKTLQSELMRIDRSEVAYVVKVEPTSPSYWGYGLFDRLTGNYAMAITVYKTPTDFRLANLPEELAKRAKQEVDQEIAKVNKEV